MKTFNFPLERVLQWRRTQLELERVALQRFTHQRAELGKALVALDANRTSAELSLVQAGSFHPGELQTMAAWQARVNREKTALRARQVQMEKEISAQMPKVTEAQRKVRLLERLRETRKKEWTHQMEGEQERFAAEAWLGRWSLEN